MQKNPHNIIYVQAAVEDAEGILSLIMQLDKSINLGILIKNLEDKLHDDKYFVFVAKIESKVIAFAELHFMHFVYEEKPRARLSSYCVDAAYRNKNIGSGFLGIMEEFCKQHNIFRVELTSNLRRMDAHRFYEANGYSFVSKAFHKTL
jgi:GNAT superfamily N-acetyltransferase